MATWPARCGKSTPRQKPGTDVVRRLSPPASRELSLKRICGELLPVRVRPVQLGIGYVVVNPALTQFAADVDGPVTASDTTTYQGRGESLLALQTLGPQFFYNRCRGIGIDALGD